MTRQFCRSTVTRSSPPRAVECWSPVIRIGPTRRVSCRPRPATRPRIMNIRPMVIIIACRTSAPLSVWGRSSFWTPACPPPRDLCPLQGGSFTPGHHLHARTRGAVLDPLVNRSDNRPCANGRYMRRHPPDAFETSNRIPPTLEADAHAAALCRRTLLCSSTRPAWPYRLGASARRCSLMSTSAFHRAVT